MDNEIKTVLFVDDQADLWIDIFSSELSRYGLNFEKELDADKAVRRIREIKPDVVLLDIMFGTENKGLSTLKKIHDMKDSRPVVMITTTFDSEPYTKPIEYEKAGAVFCVSKSDLQTGEEAAYRHLADRLQDAIKQGGKSDEIDVNKLSLVVGSSEKMKQVAKLILMIAKTDLSVLITGESGTGKERIATAIHSYSNRSSGTFVAVNCSAVPKDLLESEFFGHEKGAFTGAHERKIGTFEMAEGGTLFLDEIGDMSMDLQAKLLRVIQEKEFRRVGGSKEFKADVRIIAATNRDLIGAIKDGKFREDLFYRLNVIPIQLPPLRERLEDMELLFKHFVKKHNNELQTRILTTFRPDVKELFSSFLWPGNIRQLENSIKRAMILAKSTVLEASHFSFLTDGGSLKSSFLVPEDAAEKIFKKEISYDVILKKYRRDSHEMRKMVETLINKITDSGIKTTQEILANYLQTTVSTVKALTGEKKDKKTGKVILGKISLVEKKKTKKKAG